MNFFETFWVGVLNTSWIEWIAVLTGVIYVILASYRSIWCWAFAFASSSLFVYICFIFDLYIESGLQVFYVIMAVVGWWSWKDSKRIVNQQNSELLDTPDKAQFVRTWSLKTHGLNIILSGMGAFVLGWVFDSYSQQAYPYLDAFTTIFSLLATFMVTMRVLENWIYWVVIDAVSIVLYTSRGLYLSSVLYALFTVLAVIGFIAWFREYKLQKA